MARIPPTTAIDLDRTDRSPCCDADLVLSSPPDGYECRECMEPYHIGPSAGVESDGADSEGDTTSDDGEGDETYRCGVNDCSREVDAPEDTCWQHED